MCATPSSLPPLYTSFNPGPHRVYFWGTHHTTEATNAMIYRLVRSLFVVMSYLMRLSFHFLPFIPQTQKHTYEFLDHGLSPYLVHHRQMEVAQSSEPYGPPADQATPTPIQWISWSTLLTLPHPHQFMGQPTPLRTRLPSSPCFPLPRLSWASPLQNPISPLQ